MYHDDLLTQALQLVVHTAEKVLKDGRPLHPTRANRIRILVGEPAGRAQSPFLRALEQDGPWCVAYCAEVPGANGQGLTRDECLANLREAIALILEHRREESLRSLPPEAKQELVIVG